MKQWLSLVIACACLLSLVVFLWVGPDDEDRPEPEAAPSEQVAKSAVVNDQESLLIITISPESRVKASAGTAKPILQQGVWVEFPLVIENGARMTSPLVIESEQMLQSDNDQARDRWLKIDIRPPGPLSGKLLEERTLRLWSRDQGKRAAVFNVNAGQGTQDLGFRSDVLMTFDVAP